MEDEMPSKPNGHSSALVDYEILKGEPMQSPTQINFSFSRLFVWLVADYPWVLFFLVPMVVFGIIGGVGIPPYPAFMEGNEARNSLGAQQLDAYTYASKQWTSYLYQMMGGDREEEVVVVVRLSHSLIALPAVTGFWKLKTDASCTSVQALHLGAGSRKHYILV